MEDYRTGIIASNILNTIPRTEKTKHKVFMPWDIFPQYNWQPEPEPVNIDQMIALTIAAGGTVTEMNRNG
jgi:hypothetical protein